MTRRALRTYVILNLIAIAVVVAAAAGMIFTYHDGYESGMRDLCGEIGGTWDDSEHGWCDVEVAR